MIYLLLSIASSGSIFLVFKVFGLRRVHLLPAITINYFIATSAGLSHNALTENRFYIQADWWPIAILLSFLFISLFYLMARTTQAQGVSVATNASKMSMIIPVIIVALIYPAEKLSPVQIAGIILALLGIYMTSKKNNQSPNSSVWLWPLLLFLGTGLLDYLLVHTNQFLIENETDNKLFTSLLFSMAFCWGIILLIGLAIKRKLKISRKEVLGGFVLGLINYGSIFFLLQAYASGLTQKSVILPVNNMGILVFSVVFSFLIFKEKLSPINITGIILSLVAISIIFFA